MKILGIHGSPSAASRSAHLLNLVRERLGDTAGSYETLHVRDLPAQALLHAQFSDIQIARAVAAVAEARIILVATPIYKAAYSGLLKSFLDLLPQDGLRDKTVLPLATGGSPAHLLALDYALKPVLSALGARDILDGIYATDTHLPADPGRGYGATPEILARLDRSVQAVLARARELREREAVVSRLVPQPGTTSPRAASDVRWSV
jgi:FMN reductase